MIKLLQVFFSITFKMKLLLSLVAKSLQRTIRSIKLNRCNSSTTESDKQKETSRQALNGKKHNTYKESQLLYQCLTVDRQIESVYHLQTVPERGDGTPPRA